MDRRKNGGRIAFALIAAFGVAPVTASAQTDYDEFRRQMNESYASFAEEITEDFDNFRTKINKDYEDFMRNNWSPTEITDPLPAPIEKEPEPDVEPEEEAPKPVVAPKPISIDVVISPPVVKPRPQPIEKIRELPADRTLPPLNVRFYGTEMPVRMPDIRGFRLAGADENAFADAWAQLSKSNTNNLIADCLRVREEFNLPDWGYVKYLDALASQLLGEDTNEKTMLLGFLLNQSGYKVRYAYDGAKRLHMLFGSAGIIYSHSRYYVDGDWFYSYTKPEGNEVYICKFSTPKEQEVAMTINKEPLFAYEPGNVREITVKRYPEIKLSLTPNKNLIDFYGDYPECTADSSPYSKWIIHGNTPVSREVREQLYPLLRKAVEGKSQLEGVSILLKVAQSFPYGYDEEIWGVDRPFWMEESWHYPQSDCEDHAVNFTHMVRDIMGLDACLVYYPGHLSSCIAFTEEGVKGDYIDYEGKRYIVCDPTYFYAAVGKTAPSNNNAEAILVPLKK